MKRPNYYRIDDLTEEEMMIIVSSLCRELHLIDGIKLYKSAVIREIIEKLNRADGPRKPSKLD